MPRTVVPAAKLFRIDSPTTLVLVYPKTGIAAPNYVPTRAEMTASTVMDVTGLIVPQSGIVGFETGVEKTQVGSMGSSKLPQTVTGLRTIADSALLSKASKNHIDMRDVMDPTDEVFLQFLFGGDVPANRSEVWYVSCSNHAALKATGQEGRVRTDFDIIDGNESVPIPA